MREPSINACSTTAFSPGSSSPMRRPTTPSVADGLLVCATEVTTSAEIATFAAALSDVLASGGVLADGRVPAGAAS